MRKYPQSTADLVVIVEVPLECGGNSNGQRSCRRQRRFMERRIEQAQGAIGQMKPNDGHGRPSEFVWQRSCGQKKPSELAVCGSDGLRRAP